MKHVLVAAVCIYTVSAREDLRSPPRLKGSTKDNCQFFAVGGSHGDKGASFATMGVLAGASLGVFVGDRDSRSVLAQAAPLATAAVGGVAGEVVNALSRPKRPTHSTKCWEFVNKLQVNSSELDNFEKLRDEWTFVLQSRRHEAIEKRGNEYRGAGSRCNKDTNSTCKVLWSKDVDELIRYQSEDGKIEKIAIAILWDSEDPFAPKFLPSDECSCKPNAQVSVLASFNLNLHNHGGELKYQVERLMNDTGIPTALEVVQMQ